MSSLYGWQRLTGAGIGSARPPSADTSNLNQPGTMEGRLQLTCPFCHSDKLADMGTFFECLSWGCYAAILKRDLKYGRDYTVNFLG